MAERAEPVPTRTGWAMLPVLRRMAAMPLKDPFAFTGLVIYMLFALVALFADQLAPLDPMEILFTKAGKLAANVPPGAALPSAFLPTIFPSTVSKVTPTPDGSGMNAVTLPSRALPTRIPRFHG